MRKQQTMEWEKRRFLVYITASEYLIISKEVEITWDTSTFVDTHPCINNTYWQYSVIVIFLCKYYIVISDTLIGLWMCFFCCSLYILHSRVCVENITFLAACPSSNVFFSCFVISLPFCLLWFNMQKLQNMVRGGRGHSPPFSLISAVLIFFSKFFFSLTFFITE